MKKINTCEYLVTYDGLIENYFYFCTCGANLIDREDASGWEYCPYCGCKIIKKQILTCNMCKYTDFENGTYYCNNENGYEFGSNVDNSDSCSCKEFKYKEM